MVAPRGPRQGLLWDLPALCACGQERGLAPPSPMSAPCSPMGGPRSPGHGTTEERPTSQEEMDKTHVNGHGRTQGEPELSREGVWASWLPAGEETSLWGISPRQPLMMSPQDQSPNTEATPAIVQRKRPDCSSQTQGPEASGETRGRGEGKELPAGLGGLAEPQESCPGGGGALRAQPAVLGPNPGSKRGTGEPQVSLRPPDCPWGWSETGEALGAAPHLPQSLWAQSLPTSAVLASGPPLLTHKYTPAPRPSRCIAVSRKGGEWEGTQGGRVGGTPLKDHTLSVTVNPGLTHQLLDGGVFW